MLRDRANCADDECSLASAPPAAPPLSTAPTRPPMKTLCALPLVFLLTSFAPLADESITCGGCTDSSGAPGTTVTSPGGCNAFTTTELWTNSGLCFGFLEICASAPCSPFLLIRNHASPGKRVTIQGVLGKSELGLHSYRTSSDTTLLRAWNEVSCGEESEYYFFVETECAGGNKVELITGAFNCTPCLAQQ